jgi:dTDP-D-glucose 4,6-dehydratase
MPDLSERMLYLAELAMVEFGQGSFRFEPEFLQQNNISAEEVHILNKLVAFALQQMIQKPNVQHAEETMLTNIVGDREMAKDIIAFARLYTRLGPLLAKARESGLENLIQQYTQTRSWGSMAPTMYTKQHDWLPPEWADQPIVKHGEGP